MFIPAFLKLKSYKPLRLEKGMIFLIPGEYITLIELVKIPTDADKWIEQCGYPVEPYIVLPTDPSLQEEEILAKPEQIGWMYEEEEEEERRILSVDDIEIIINHFDGWLDIEVTEEEDEKPAIYADLVTIKFPSNV